jgi:hypothetical protein
MAINRALMNRQMYNMGGASLQAGAPDLRLTGDVRPTYTQERKNRMDMAFGGIAGLDGRKKYGIGSWFQENIMDPIKDNPITSAVIGGGLVNEFGLPDSITKYLFDGAEDVGQNFLGDLLGKIPGVPDDLNATLGLGDNESFIRRALATALPGSDGVTDPYFDLYGIGDPTTTNMTDGQKGQLQLEKYRRRNLNADLAKALAGGAAAGAYVRSQPKDTIPEDTTGINFQTAQQVLDDPNQRFKPPVEATQLAAEGGRIGYNMGGDADTLVASYMKSPEGKQELMSKSSGGMGMPDIVNQMKQELMMAQASSQGNMQMQQPQKAAMGGRIGYGNGTPDPKIPEEFLEDLKRRKLDEMLDQYYRFQEGYERRKAGAPTQEAAMGGRIGYSEGSKNYNEDPEYRGWKTMYEKNKSIGEMHDNHSEYLNFYNSQGKAEGGLMDLGGNEMDLRAEGGFIPIGGKEKADDVPARLSKNEFVFTADAVRNAGGGNIDEGAQVMERLMKSLEQGGEVSEESQGLDGAREMFETSQRLEKRII